jgi:hypothetical protein
MGRVGRERSLPVHEMTEPQRRLVQRRRRAIELGDAGPGGAGAKVTFSQKRRGGRERHYRFPKAPSLAVPDEGGATDRSRAERGHHQPRSVGPGLNNVERRGSSGRGNHLFFFDHRHGRDQLV